MKSDFRIDIYMDGVYECVVNRQYIIIEVKPLCNIFLYKDLKDIYEQFKRQAEFHFIGYKDPKPFLPEEIFELFSYLNPSVKVLAEYFDCELL